MYKNEVPSLQAPYKLDAGEGIRYAVGNQLATRLATPAQLGQPASGTVLTGAKGASFPLHRHQDSHEALFMMYGAIRLVLASQAFLLSAGDYVNIPPGTPHGYEFLDHHSKLLSWSFGGNAADAYAVLGTPYRGTIYPEENGAVNWTVLDRTVDTELLEMENIGSSSFASKLSSAPQGVAPFVLAAWQLYTILGNQTHSNGAFIALLTEGPIGPAIPRHQHEKVTELFHCLNGQMEMYAGDGFLTLDPGDFLHVPPRTPHSFQLKKHDTRFLGFVTPGHFEAFFRYLCEPFEGHRYPLVPPPFRFDRVIQHLAELDLTVLERPTAPPSQS